MALQMTLGGGKNKRKWSLYTHCITILYGVMADGQTCGHDWPSAGERL